MAIWLLRNPPLSDMITPTTFHEKWSLPPIMPTISPALFHHLANHQAPTVPRPLYAPIAAAIEAANGGARLTDPVRLPSEIQAVTGRSTVTISELIQQFHLMAFITQERENL